ncbi:MAG: hypothetical protein Q4A79_02695 [Candidatus Saccharibacteria bacterium]|nr:hypothetical protein [Candidatus Saccharibacteria bacterium]
MNPKKGLTKFEIAIIIIFIVVLIPLIAFPKASLDAIFRDETRKTAINAIYYSLEKDFYAKNGYYPASLSAETLPTVPEELWRDPSGYEINTPLGTYFYEPGDCFQNRCQKYLLKASLEREADYLKTSQN